MDLDRLVGDHGQHFRGFQLRHRHVGIGSGAGIVFPSGLEDHQFRRLHLDGHVGEFERDALKLANGLAELLAARGIVYRMGECTFCPAEAGCPDLQPRRAEPLVGDVETLVDFAQYVLSRDAAIVEFENGIGVAAMADIAVTVAHGETGGVLVDEEGSDERAFSARRVFLTRLHEADRETGNVGMADEMLGAVQHPVIAILLRRRLHAAQVGARARLGHGEAVPGFAAQAGFEIFFALLRRAGAKDVGGPGDAGPVKRVIGAAKLLFVEEPCQRIETAATKLLRDVGGIQPRGDRLFLKFAHQIGIEMSAALDLGLMWIEFVLDESTGGLDHHALLLGEAEIHHRVPMLAGGGSFDCASCSA